MTFPAILVRLTTRRTLLAILGLWFAYSTYFFQFSPYPRLSQYGVADARMFDLSSYYDPAQADAALGAFGDAGRRLYLQYLPQDVIFLLLHSSLAMLLGLGLRGLVEPRSRWQLLVWLPLAAGAADLLENTFILAMIARYPAPAGLLARATALFTSVKLLLVPVIFLSTLLVWTVAGVHRLLARR